MDQCPRDVSGARLGWSDPLSEGDSTMWVESHLLQQANPPSISPLPLFYPLQRYPADIMQAGVWVGFPERNIVSAGIQGHVHPYTQLISF